MKRGKALTVQQGEVIRRQGLIPNEWSVLKWGDGWAVLKNKFSGEKIDVVFGRS